MSFSLSALAVEPTSDSSGIMCVHRNLDNGAQEIYYQRLYNASASCPGYVHSETYVDQNNNQIIVTKTHAGFAGAAGTLPDVNPIMMNDPLAHNCLTFKFRLGGGQ